jgi:hypothetical protein
MAQYKYLAPSSKYFHFLGFCLLFVFLWKFVFFLVAAYTELVGENFQENPLLLLVAHKTFYFYESWFYTPAINYFNLFLAKTNRLTEETDLFQKNQLFFCDINVFYILFLSKQLYLLTQYEYFSGQLINFLWASVAYLFICFLNSYYKTGVGISDII